MSQTVICPDCGAQLLVEDQSRKFAVCPYCGAQVRINVNVNLNYNYNYSKSEHTERIIDEAKSKNADNVNRVIGIFATPFEEYRAQKDHERRMEEEAQRAAEEQTREWYRQAHEDAQLRAEHARAREAERAKRWRACEKKILRFCRKHPKETLLSLAVCCVLFFSGIAAWSNYATKQQQQADHNAELARLEHERIAYSHLAEGEVQMPEIETDTDYRIVKQDFENAGFTNITTEPVPDLTSTTTTRYNRVIEVTVDGVPRMNVGSWYPVDVPIVITYHTVGDETLTPAEQAYSIAQGLLHGKSEN